jgi:hypothetical protein
MKLLASVTSLALVVLGVSLPPPPTAEPVVLRLEKVRLHIPGVPAGTDYRVQNGAEGIAFAMCDVQRAYSNSRVEHGCRLYDESLNRWGQSVRWYSAEALQPLTNETARVVKTASR